MFWFCAGQFHNHFPSVPILSTFNEPNLTDVFLNVSSFRIFLFFFWRWIHCGRLWLRFFKIHCAGVQTFKNLPTVTSPEPLQQRYCQDLGGIGTYWWFVENVFWIPRRIAPGNQKLWRSQFCLWLDCRLHCDPQPGNWGRKPNVGMTWGCTSLWPAISPFWKCWKESWVGFTWMSNARLSLSQVLRR